MKFVKYAPLALIVGAGAANATDSAFTSILAGVDVSSVATTVGTVGLALVGIYMAFKGIQLARRLVSKV